MAIDAHSTTAPAVQPGLLRTWAGAVPVPTPALTAETVAMLDGLASEFPPAPIPSLVSLNLRRRHLNESQRAMAAAKLANMKSGHAASQRQPHEMVAENDGVGIPTPCISQREAADLLNVSRSTVIEAKKVLNEGTAETVAMLDAIPADVPHRGAPICSASDLPCGVASDVRHGGAGFPLLPHSGEQFSLDLAQAIHMRRALEGALDHGTALLAALGLPRLMEPGFVPLDPAAIGDALDTAIATLDALDASAEDLEDGHDAEHDLADAEHDLGWPAYVSQVNLGRNTDDGDITALERHGRGFIRSGPDDSEDDDPAGAQQRDEDALFWSIDVGCTIGAPVNREADHV